MGAVFESVDKILKSDNSNETSEHYFPVMNFVTFILHTQFEIFSFMWPEKTADVSRGRHLSPCKSTSE